jgi:hypothetical protein
MDKHLNPVVSYQEVSGLVEEGVVNLVRVPANYKRWLVRVLNLTFYVTHDVLGQSQSMYSRLSRGLPMSGPLHQDRETACLSNTMASKFMYRTDSKKLTKAIWAEPKMVNSSIDLIMLVTLDGLPGGCLKARFGSGFSQYSLSHSIGSSTS